LEKTELIHKNGEWENSPIGPLHPDPFAHSKRSDRSSAVMGVSMSAARRRRNISQIGGRGSVIHLNESPTARFGFLRLKVISRRILEVQTDFATRSLGFLPGAAVPGRSPTPGFPDFQESRLALDYLGFPQFRLSPDFFSAEFADFRFSLNSDFYFDSLQVPLWFLWFWILS